MNLPDELKHKRIAIVTDWLTSRGGAERVIEALADCFPEAPIYTSVYRPELFPEFAHRDVRTTFLQKLPQKLRCKHQFLLALYPSAFRHLDLSEYDIIVSSCSAFSKCLNLQPHQKHFCYCHTPVRYLYHAEDEYRNTYPLPWFLRWVRWILPPLMMYLRRKDQKAAARVDYFIANSDYIAKRIETYYHRKSTTIYPRIDTKPFVKAAAEYPKQDYFLAIGRFIPYKKFDLLVQAFVANGLPLKLAGMGPELAYCQKLAEGASNIEFLGFVEDEALPKLYAQARGFLFPAEEDFGITPVEAMASGTPVIYYARGGACESVVGFGVAFENQTVDALQKGIDFLLAHERDYPPKKLIERGQEFDRIIFQKKILDFILSHL